LEILEGLTMPAYRIYMKGTFYGTAICKDKEEALKMMEIEIKEKGKDGEPDGLKEHKYVWKEVVMWIGQ
jgi:hypothetical protein